MHGHGRIHDSALARKVVPPSVPGITATTISLGIPYTKNQQAANAALGAGGLYADSRQAFNAMLDEVNKEGGLAGPRVLEHAVDTVLSFDGDPPRYGVMLIHRAMDDTA